MAEAIVRRRSWTVRLDCGLQKPSLESDVGTERYGSRERYAMYLATAGISSTRTESEHDDVEDRNNDKGEDRRKE
jgi:hypothetical protein